MGEMTFIHQIYYALLRMMQGGTPLLGTRSASSLTTPIRQLSLAFPQTRTGVWVSTYLRYHAKLLPSTTACLDYLES